jgi:hypothetical protein
MTSQELLKKAKRIAIRDGRVPSPKDISERVRGKVTMAQARRIYDALVAWFSKRSAQLPATVKAKKPVMATVTPPSGVPTVDTVSSPPNGHTRAPEPSYSRPKTTHSYGR